MKIDVVPKSKCKATKTYWPYIQGIGLLTIPQVQDENLTDSIFCAKFFIQITYVFKHRKKKKTIQYLAIFM